MGGVLTYTSRGRNVQPNQIVGGLISIFEGGFRVRSKTARNIASKADRVNYPPGISDYRNMIICLLGLSWKPEFKGSTTKAPNRVESRVHP